MRSIKRLIRENKLANAKVIEESRKHIKDLKESGYVRSGYGLALPYTTVAKPKNDESDVRCLDVNDA